MTGSMADAGCQRDLSDVDVWWLLALILSWPLFSSHLRASP